MTARLVKILLWLGAIGIALVALALGNHPPA
jgi:hypothetical protein